MATGDALNDAVAAFDDPQKVSDMRARPLADEVALVLRVTAGDKAALDLACSRTGLDRERICEATMFYLQQVLFGPNANAYRTLGCAPDAPQQQLKEHYRWLIKWLHPDRNMDQWEAVYADKVNIAWQSLKTPARRDRYNEDHGIDLLQFQNAPTVLTVHSGAALADEADQAGRDVLLSGNVVRHLPAITLSIMGLSAAVLLGLMYWVNRESPPVATAQALRSDAVVPVPDPVPLPVSVVTQNEPLEPAALAMHVPEQSSASPFRDSSLEDISEEMGFADSAVAGVQAPSAETRAAVARLLAAGQQSELTSGSQTEDLVPRTDPFESQRLAVAALDRLNQSGVKPAQFAAGKPNQSDTVKLAAAESGPVAAPPEAVTPLPETPLPAVAVAAQTLPAIQPSQPSLSPSVPATALAVPERPAQIAVAETTAPASTVVQSVPRANGRRAAPSTIRGPSATQAAALVQDFTSAYTAGDLARFDRLFSGSVTKHRDLNGLRGRMQQAQMRYLELAEVRWELDTEAAVGRARYRETFVLEGERKAVTRVGDLQWVIRMNGSQPRIAAISVQAKSR